MFTSAWSKVLGGFLLGTVGLPLLKTKTAEKVYTYVTAGAFICKDKVMEEAEIIQAKAMNVSDDAKAIAERYYQSKDQAFEAAVEGEDTDSAFEETSGEAQE